MRSRNLLMLSTGKELLPLTTTDDVMSISTVIIISSEDCIRIHDVHVHQMCYWFGRQFRIYGSFLGHVS
jgi:hypothetical protein